MRRRETRKVWELWDQPVRTRPYMAWRMDQTVGKDKGESWTGCHSWKVKAKGISQLERPHTDGSPYWIVLN